MPDYQIKFRDGEVMRGLMSLTACYRRIAAKFGVYSSALIVSDMESVRLKPVPTARQLVWLDRKSCENDDGSRACCEIIRKGAELRSWGP